MKELSNFSHSFTQNVTNLLQGMFCVCNMDENLLLNFVNVDTFLKIRFLIFFRFHSQIALRRTKEQCLRVFDETNLRMELINLVTYGGKKPLPQTLEDYFERCQELIKTHREQRIKKLNLYVNFLYFFKNENLSLFIGGRE